MTRDYSLPDDPYGIASEYTAQSADIDAQDRKKEPVEGVDVRGNTTLTPRSIPTQAEADAAR